MKNIFKIVKKELDKIFMFPRTLFTTLILPGLVLFIIYAIIGNVANAEISKGEEHITIVHVINIPDSLAFAKENSEEFKIELHEDSIEKLDELKETVKNGDIDILLLYDEDFDLLIAEGNNPTLNAYYNVSEMNAEIIYNKLNEIVSLQREKLLKDLNIDPNIFNYLPQQLVDEDKVVGNILAMLLPILLITFIFAGAMSVGSDAIAGEKERGTLATLLMAPLEREEIILGKTISTTIINICYAASSFIGIIASLPFLKPLLAGNEVIISYGILDYLALLIIIIILSMFASTLFLVASTIAKTNKEATMLGMPVYIIALILPMMTMYAGKGSESLWLYFIPIYNCILGMKSILLSSFSISSFLALVGSSIVILFILILVLIKLFKSERVLFAK